MSYDIKRSVSLYSYQDEYYNGQLDLEGCLRETAKTGATGVELLAEQMIKRFPLPIETQEFRDHWFEMLKKYNLEHLSRYGHYCPYPSFKPYVRY